MRDEAPARADVPTMFVMVGLPGAGKTTAAEQLERDHHALRLTPDEWMIPLFGEPEGNGKRDVFEGRFIWLAIRALRAGTNVVLDFGCWSRDERTALRSLAEAEGANFELVYLPIGDDEQGVRMSARVSTVGLTTFAITEAELAQFRVERKPLAREVLADIRRLDAQLKELRSRIVAAVELSGTTVTAVDGVGPIVAAIICGRVGNIGRFPSAGHFARYNGTAPIEASSGPRVRHRLNRRGDRHLNHAIHVAAIAQLSRDTAGRAYFEGKLAEGKSKKEAVRSLKRRISDAVYRQLLLDARR